MSNYTFTGYSFKLISKKIKKLGFSDEQFKKFKKIIKEIEINPKYNPGKPGTITTYKGITKKDCTFKEYRTRDLNLRVLYTIFNNSKQIEITDIAKVQDFH